MIQTRVSPRFLTCLAKAAFSQSEFTSSCDKPGCLFCLGRQKRGADPVCELSWSVRGRGYAGLDPCRYHPTEIVQNVRRWRAPPVAF